jgi:putative endonuclease
MSWFKRVLKRITSHTRAPRLPQTRAETGRMGERVAADFLKEKGYRILERNFTVRRGEIDIVAFNDGGLVFVEVRSRRHTGLRDPAESVDRRKQKRVIKAAQCYIARRRVRSDTVCPRFDVISVRFDPSGGAPTIAHIRNAFALTRAAFS